MNGLRLSQESVACNAILPGKTENIEMLLNMTADTEIDRELLEHVRRYLEKVSEELGGPRQEVNHDLLQKVLRCLQTWAISPLVGKLLKMGIVRNLAVIYDNVIQADHSRSELMTSTLELLFVVEDMSDSTEGKIQCGQFFLLRLLGLATATAKSPSVKLQRAAVETICALITRSPENQQAVLEQKVECYKLFTLFLPRCGDFQLQGSITEIFYRLVRRGPHLLEFLQDAAVRKAMESLMQSKQPALLSEIRKIVTLLNESLGPVRSVYSFLAEGIIINGHIMNMTDKWVNFGRGQLSFFIVGLPEQNIDESSMITDVLYEDIIEIKNACAGPSTFLLDILVQDPGLSSFKALQLESGPSTVVHLQMCFNRADLSTIEASVLPKIRSNSMASPVRRQGKGANSPFVDKPANKSWKGGSTINCKVQPTRILRSVPSNKISPTGDGKLQEWTERRGQKEKCTFDYFHTSPDLAFESPQDPETIKGAASTPHESLTAGDTRSEWNQIFNGIISDGPNLKAPVRPEEEYRYQPRIAAVTPSFEHINLRNTDGQLFPRRQAQHELHDNIEPVDLYQKTSVTPPIENQTRINRSQTIPTTVRHANENCENRRTSKPSHLKTHNLQDLSGPKTKSPSDANLRTGVETDDETAHETDNSERGAELRMKKRQDPQHTKIVALESPDHLGKDKLVRNICHQVNNAKVQEAQQSAESSERNLITPPKDMLVSDSVMTDIREKPVIGGKSTQNYHRRPSRAVLNIATGPGENWETNAARPQRKRTCKKPTIYFDADDDLTSSASDSSQEFVVTRQKESSGMVTDPAIHKSVRRRTQTISSCERRPAAHEENRVLSFCRKNGPLPDKHGPCGTKANVTKSMSRKQNSFTKRWANHERKVASASTTKKNLVEDVFRFTSDPAEERQTRKTSLSLSCKARQNSDYAEPHSKRRKQQTVESHNLLSIARQSLCTSDGPRLVIPVRQPAKVVKSPPTGSPVRTPPAKQEKVTPQKPASAGVSSDSSDHSRSPVLQARKTYTKSERIITKHSRLERWKSCSIRKLELPTLDATSQEESSYEAARRNSPHAKGIEVEDVASDSEDSSGIGVIAKLLENFKQKVKVVEKKSVGDVLSNTMQRIQNKIQSAEEHVRGEKTELLNACNKRCGRLDSQLQEQIKTVRALYDKFKLDFAQHIERHDMIVGEIEETKLELNDLAKQQARLKSSITSFLSRKLTGQDHRDVLNKLKESCRHLLAAADQNVLEIGKGSNGMRGLREALQGILKDL